MNRILLVEDDESLGYVLSEYLKMHEMETVWVKNGREALITFAEEQVSACILDIMMPELDGFQLARLIREQNKHVPIIFLTAKALKVDKLKGFEIGADDYITKPVDEEELLARIKAVLRRATLPSDEAPAIIHFRGHELDLDRRLLIMDGTEHHLAKKECLILQMLLRHRNRLLTRDEALKELWGKNDYFNRRSMDVHITKLRKILRVDPSLEIINVHGKGFILKLADG